MIVITINKSESIKQLFFLIREKFNKRKAKGSCGGGVTLTFGQRVHKSSEDASFPKQNFFIHFREALKQIQDFFEIFPKSKNIDKSLFNLEFVIIWIT